MYQYQAKVLRIVDGDTIDVAVDCGFSIVFSMKVRFYGINAPELSTPEGQAAKIALLTQITVGDTIFMKTIKDHQEKYGRYLAVIYKTLNDTKSVNDWMVENGFAVVYLP